VSDLYAGLGIAVVILAIAVAPAGCALKGYVVAKAEAVKKECVK
jgi:hypothetical protein